MIQLLTLYTNGVIAQSHFTGCQTNDNTLLYNSIANYKRNPLESFLDIIFSFTLKPPLKHVLFQLLQTSKFGHVIMCADTEIYYRNIF